MLIFNTDKNQSAFGSNMDTLSGEATLPCSFFLCPVSSRETDTVIQIRRGNRDNYPYFSIKTYFVTIIRAVSPRRF